MRGIPIDKSIAQRCAILGLDFDGKEISEDVKHTIKAANALKSLREDVELDLGNSGTGMRLLTGYIVGMGKAAILLGDASLSKRPMKRIADPLSEWGAKIELTNNKFAPIKINRSELKPKFKYHLEIASAQIKSCLLMAAVSSGSQIEIEEHLISRDHTERLLEECDGLIKKEGKKIFFDGRKKLTKKKIDIPKDFSCVAYFLAADILTGRINEIKNVGVNKTRTAFLDILKEMGAKIEQKNLRIISNEPRADLKASITGPLKGVTILGDMVPNLIDEIPLIAILAMFAQGKTVVRGAKELRYKESDRISLLLLNLKKFNPNIELREFEDGFEINPKEHNINKDLSITTNGDHRMLMSFAIAGLRINKAINFDDTSCVDTSFPKFFNLIQKCYQ